MGCAKNDNPFFKAYENKYGAPPFDQIKPEHYMPAFKEGIKEQQAEIDAIADITNSAETKRHLIGVLLERGLKHLIA